MQRSFLNNYITLRRRQCEASAPLPQCIDPPCSNAANEDALALYQEYKDRGLPVSAPFVGNGMWVVMLKDPDGYKLEFESLTDVAEETTYTAWREGMLKSEKESK